MLQSALRLSRSLSIWSCTKKCKNVLIPFKVIYKSFNKYPIQKQVVSGSRLTTGFAFVDLVDWVCSLLSFQNFGLKPLRIFCLTGIGFSSSFWAEALKTTNATMQASWTVEKDIFKKTEPMWSQKVEALNDSCFNQPLNFLPYDGKLYEPEKFCHAQTSPTM